MQDTWGQFGNFRILFYNGEKPFHIGTFLFLCIDFTPEDSRHLLKLMLLFLVVSGELLETLVRKFFRNSIVQPLRQYLPVAHRLVEQKLKHSHLPLFPISCYNSSVFQAGVSPERSKFGRSGKKGGKYALRSMDTTEIKIP